MCVYVCVHVCVCVCVCVCIAMDVYISEYIENDRNTCMSQHIHDILIVTMVTGMCVCV